MKKYLLALSLLLPVLAHGEATKEYLTDAGVYNATPFTIVTFAFSQVFLDFNATTDPTPPEGLKVANTTVTTQWGGWGIFNTVGFNDFNYTQRDFSDYLNGSLRFWLKSTTPLDFRVEFLEGGANVQVSSTVASTGGLWREVNIPLSASVIAGGLGLNLTRLQNIRAPFIVATSQPDTAAAKSWAIDHIRWTKPVASLAIFPPSTTVQQGKKRQFTVEGRDSVGERIPLYTTFDAGASVGTFNPGVPSRVTASTLTANSFAGSATSNFLALSTSSFVNVVATPVDDSLGLLSETVTPAITLNTDSVIGTSFGGGAVGPTLLDEVSADVREGTHRFKTTVPAQPQVDSFSGWFVQWNTNTSDALTRDMSTFYEGSLRFWFKGPAALQNILQVSIRSGNVVAGTELSKVNLRDFVAFDDQWHPVSIPLKRLAGARPWADLSRTKILFGMFTIGQLGAQQIYYIDNLRWDTRTPGALATISIVPGAVTVPLGAKRQFTAIGRDANGVQLDIFPTWSAPGSIGTFTPTQGAMTLLTAAASPATGNLTATQGISTSAVVTVANITWLQSLNVYSDSGSGGFVGVAKSTSPSTQMGLTEQTLGVGVAPEGVRVRRSTYTLVNNPGMLDAYAVWFTNVDTGNGTKFLRYYDTGYLQFWVKTTKDLQISLRSGNIAAGAERSKFRLSELGVPLDNNWQKVIIALNDFKIREPLLDFDQIQTYFAIGALASQVGQVANQTFDVDDVKWLTNNPGVPDENKVYAGLVGKQVAGGLVRSFDNDVRAVTYDEALAALNYTYRKDVVLSKKVFDVYKYIHDNYTQPSGAFSGFHDEYHVNSAVGSYTILNANRTAGPNAWMLLALIHYRNVTGQTTYDTVINDLATWLFNLRAADGSVQYGRNGASLLTQKSTEHNFDAYAAFKAYYRISGNATYDTAANTIFNWLDTQMYIPSQQRFKAGTISDGVTSNWDRALDNYSWAPLALSSYTNVLATAETDFVNTKVCDLTGISVTGFDFSGPALLTTTPPGPPADKDAVWLEGTGQMALAYYLVENAAKGDFYVQELDKTIINTSPTGQGNAYATNAGTAYGFQMNSFTPAVSSMAWYLFAKKKFNPFKPFPIHTLRVQDVTTGVVRSSVTWTANVPTTWVRANQLIRLDAQPITTDPWGIQIYTDNTNPSFNPRFVDPTPGPGPNANNSDSNPAGLVLLVPGQSTSTVQINMAWSIKDSTAAGTVPVAEAPEAGTPNSFQWIYMKDSATPNIPSLNTTLFVNGEDAVTVRNLSGSHFTQGPTGYFPSLMPDYLYMEANFGTAAAQATYRGNITVEFFLQ